MPGCSVNHCEEDRNMLGLLDMGLVGAMLIEMGGGGIMAMI